MTRSVGYGARAGSEQGAVGIFSVLLVVALVTVGAAVWGLNRTADLATQIDRRSESIATAGTGINAATKAIIQLENTNQLGDSIEATAQPLQGQLDEVIRIAQSINATAGSINGTATNINSTAKGINGEAGAILGIGRSINDGVEQINKNVEVTIDLIRQIKGDTGNILGQARLAHQLAACIDKGLSYGGVNSTAEDDGHCNG